MDRLIKILRFFNLLEDDKDQLDLGHMLIYVGVGLLIYTTAHEPTNFVSFTGAIAGAVAPSVMALATFLPALQGYRQQRRMRAERRG